MQRRRPFDSDSDSDHESGPRLLNSYAAARQQQQQQKQQQQAPPQAPPPPTAAAPTTAVATEPKPAVSLTTTAADVPEEPLTSITILGEELHLEDFAEFDESAYAAHRQDAVKSLQQDRDEVEELLREQTAHRLQQKAMWEAYWQQTYGGQDSNVDMESVKEELAALQGQVAELKAQLADVHRSHTTTQMRHEKDEDELVTEINRLRTKLL